MKLPALTRPQSRRRLPAQVATLLVSASMALAACGGGDDGAAAPERPGTDPAAGPSETRPADTGAEPAAPDSPGDDGCQVEVTGDKTASWTAGGGISALNTQYWLSPDQLGMFGESFYFIVNCSGEAGSLSFGATAKATEETIPYGPATYTLEPASNVMGTGEGEAPIGVLLTLTDSETNWGLSEPGVLEITRFDDERITGTFSFTATDVLNSSRIGDQSRFEGTITVKGSFDFRNPN